MKRLIALLTVVIIAVVMVSCIKPNDPEPDPMNTGRKIYLYAADQNDHAFIPAEIALKFNILLTEARKQGKTDLSDVVVKIGTSDVNLKDRYLPGAEIESDGSGNYQIKFQQSHNYTYYIWDGLKIRISGIVNVDTKGKLLDDLQQGDGWVVSVASSTLNYFTYVIYGYYTYEMLLSSDVSYTITPGSGERTWDMSFQKFVAQFNNGPNSDWSGNFGVKQLNGTDLSFEEAAKSSFEVSGEASGKTMSGYSMTYTSESVVYTPACKPILQSGKVTATAEVSISESTPDDTAIVEFEKTGTGCDQIVYLTYNKEKVKF